MSEASMPDRGAAAPGAGRRGKVGSLALPVACMLAGMTALATALVLLGGPARTFADTLAIVAWAWLLLGLPLLAVLVIGGIGAARHGREPRLLGVARWFAIGLATGVVLLESPRLLL